MKSSQIRSLRRVMEVLNQLPNRSVEGCELPDSYAAAAELSAVLRQIAPSERDKPQDPLEALLYEKVTTRQLIVIPRDELPSEYPTEDGAENLRDWIELNSYEYRFGLPETTHVSESYVEIEV